MSKLEIKYTRLKQQFTICKYYFKTQTYEPQKGEYKTQMVSTRLKENFKNI